MRLTRSRSLLLGSKPQAGFRICGAGRKKTQAEIAVRNPECLKGTLAPVGMASQSGDQLTFPAGSSESLVATSAEERLVEILGVP